MNIGFLQDLLSSVAEQGRHLADRLGLGSSAVRPDPGALPALIQALLSTRGEASGVGLAREIMGRYRELPASDRLALLQLLAKDFADDPEMIRKAFAAYDADPNPQTHHALLQVVEPPRQEVLRRLNLAPGNTHALVLMREDLLDAIGSMPELAALDRDFVHLFSSWFNRGFLVLRRIDWSSPAHILEKIIRYEAVHAIESWDDLRRRIEPADRRCFAFFHPALVDEPLIFVEVALTRDKPAAIDPILAEGRAPLPPGEAQAAVFYSISNCQKGLAGISFGNFLIKQVVDELRRELPQLDTFVTLSPVPGFRRWLEDRQAGETSLISDEERLALAGLPEMPPEAGAVEPLPPCFESVLARYFVEARTSRGRIVDPVARFHLGNGARLDRLNLLADRSAKGWRESYGAMVNYLYDLSAIEENHERFATHHAVVAAPSVVKAARSIQSSRDVAVARSAKR
ncbi:MAG: malonyl-CoA decarboxylase [Beijerinckiaceae bacterium]|jgi:malonyl-CoA decarboxylase|nr:malonyl-CoA decarboxylase [Beijerinckiaceae bacterium]